MKKFSSLLVKDLKHELSQRDIPVSGKAKKQDLKNLLQEFFEELHKTSGLEGTFDMNDIDFEDSESLPLNDPCSPRKKVSLIDIISSTDETVKTEKPDFDLDTSQESIDLTEEPSESVTKEKKKENEAAQKEPENEAFQKETEVEKVDESEKSETEEEIDEAEMTVNDAQTNTSNLSVAETDLSFYRESGDETEVDKNDLSVILDMKQEIISDESRKPSIDNTEVVNLDSDDSRKPSIDNTKLVDSDENMDSEGPEEVSFSKVENVLSAEKSERSPKKAKKIRKRAFQEPGSNEVEVSAPLDQSLLENLERSEEISKLQNNNKSTPKKKQKLNEKRKPLELPNEPGMHFIKERKTLRLNASSETAMSFREQMMNRHNRVSAEATKRNIVKSKFEYKKKFGKKSKSEKKLVY